MVKLNKKTLSFSDFWVSSHDKLSDFYSSSWQRGESPIPLLVIRLLLAGVSVGIMTWSLTKAQSIGGGPYWLIYLTNWGLLLLTTTTLTGLFVSTITTFKRTGDSEILPWYVSMYWFLFNLSIPLALIITALFWILIYDIEKYEDGDAHLFWVDVSTHAFNSCIAFTELLVSRTPVRILHVYQPLAVGLWYSAFTGIYFAAGGTDMHGNPYVYEVLDWRQGNRAGIVVAAAVMGLFTMYVIIWSVALCRDKISSVLVRTTSHDLPIAPPDRHMPSIV